MTLENDIEQIRETIIQLAYHFVGTREQAEDLAHDTLVKALLNRKNFDKERDIHKWLYVIMKNHFINLYRRNKAFLNYQRTVKTDGRDHSNPLWKCIAEETKQKMRLLSKQENRCLNLFLQGYTYKEITEMTLLTLSTVKIRIFRARKKLLNINK